MTEIAFGILGPAVVAVVSWILAERTYRHNPEALTSLMIAAFGAKLLFFGVYVAVAIEGLSLRPGPFVASFAGSFIVLHLAEALCLRRLFSGDVRASR